MAIQVRVVEKEVSWLPVKDYEGIYEVSNTGDLRSKDRKVKTWFGVRTCGGKPVCGEVNRDGYRRVHMSEAKTGKKDRVYLHRLVASAFIENPLNKPCINHKDGNKLNNSVDNLEWVTHQENVIHEYATGLCKGPRGELCGTHKLTEKQVVTIRNCWTEGVLLQKELAKMFDVSRECISSIVHKRNWKHI